MLMSCGLSRRKKLTVVPGKDRMAWDCFVLETAGFKKKIYNVSNCSVWKCRVIGNHEALDHISVSAYA